MRKKIYKVHVTCGSFLESQSSRYFSQFHVISSNKLNFENYVLVANCLLIFQFMLKNLLISIFFTEDHYNSLFLLKMTKLYIIIIILFNITSLKHFFVFSFHIHSHQVMNQQRHLEVL